MIPNQTIRNKLSLRITCHRKVNISR